MNKLALVSCLIAFATFRPAIARADPLSLDTDDKENRVQIRKEKAQEANPNPPVDASDYNRPHRAPPRYKSTTWEFIQNPDRYPSILLQENALQTVEGHQDTVSIANNNDLQHGQNLFQQTAVLSGILPLAEWFSLTVAGGITLNEISSAKTQQFNATVNDNSIGLYLVGFRFYLVGSAPFWEAEKNPDRWPSIGVTGQGSTSMAYEVANSQTDSLTTAFQAVNTQTWRIDLDNHLPLCDWYTAVPDIYGLYQMSTSPRVIENATTGIDASTSHLRFLGGTLEQRFYLVGKNLLFDDKGLNPDRWSSFYTILGGQSALSGDNSFTGVDANAHSRGNDSKSLFADFGFRLPMTSHATLRLEADLTYTDNFSSEVPGFRASSRVRETQLGGLAQFRYYFF